MTTGRELLPLFPLNSVLFPFSRMQLHVFEQRYRQMIAHCLAHSIPFGVVLIRAGEEVGDTAEPYLIGTKVRILDTFHYEDGRYDLTVEGVERFRIRDLDSQEPYLRGHIEPLDELAEIDEGYLGQLCEEARSLGETLVKEHIDNREFAIRVLFPEEPVQLSFALANMLDFPPLRKQYLLELVETSIRLESLIEVLRELVASIDKPMKKLTSQDLRDWVTPN
ncbi:MAG: LON peptidase substrate-binding domain-containing protein [Armatimonadetes bacterium]|nr:LON peptidase substrate-binding domain-containing protein [Armatimonadota bacterium]